MRVLHVEDDAVDADLARRALTRHLPDCTLELAPTCQLALEHLAGKAPYDLVLADLRLPDGSGLDVLAHIRERGLPLAVVILTGAGDEAAAVAALKAGADDYLGKKGDYLDRLPHTLTAALARFNALSERRTKPLRVLYVEEDPYDIELTLRHFARHAPHIRLEVIANAAEALVRLPQNADENAAHDAVLLGYRLFDLNPLDVVKVLRNERGLDLPLVLVTKQGSEEMAVHALHLGVDDYLIKRPGYLYELSAVLEKVTRQAELVREHKALQESEAKYRRLVEGLQNEYFFYRLDTRGVLTYLSPSITPMLGYTAEEFGAVIGQGIACLPTVAKCLGRGAVSMANEGSQLCDVEIRHKDGSIRCFEVLETPIFDEGGVFVEVDGIAHDISERKKTQARLKQWATVFESTRDGVMITDLEGYILAVNRAFTEITGFTEAEVLGQTPRVLKSGRQDRDFYQALWASVLEAGHWQGEIWNRRKNGEIYPEWLTLNTVRNSEGKVTHYVGVFTDISKIKESEARLQHLAYHDPLTDLPNRLLLSARLDHAVERARRSQHKGAVLFLDLDRFKTINDSLGHPTGDELLKLIARRIDERLRNVDTLARLGGDEFVMLLEEITRPEDAAAVANALLHMLQQPFTLGDKRDLCIAASIGISIYPDNGTTSAELIRNADAAMYQAKGQGGNTYRFYTESMTRVACERLAMEAKLRRALEHGDFVLHYQPFVAVDGGHIVGAEALIRWQPPAEAQVPPADFIPLAEETGLIVPIGEWVLHAACTQTNAWRNAGLLPLRIAVNLSPGQFRRADVIGQIFNALNLSGLPPDCLELEITESLLMEQGEEFLIIPRKLKEAGIRLAIDDFGTGYSSLAYLKRFPIDKLKIDRSFVRDIPLDRNDMEIVATIIAMARNLRYEVLAEGVETESQLSFLRTHGCDSYQGYLHSAPLPAEEFARRFLMPTTIPLTKGQSSLRSP